MSRSQSRGARTLAVLSALLVLALSIAIYTPLHRHQVSAPYRCTLNNVDQAVAETATYVEAVVFVLLFVAMVLQASEQRQVWFASPVRVSRGPPAF